VYGILKSQCVRGGVVSLVMQSGSGLGADACEWRNNIYLPVHGTATPKVFVSS
jgi:hypothetical protein